MRCLLLLATFLPLGAQVAGVGHWTLGVQRLAPSLSGTYYNQDGAAVSTFDLEKDLALQKDSTSLGVFGEYEGRRFMLIASTGGQTYQGHNVLTSSITVNGTTYTTGTDLRSTLKLATADITWVIKILRWDHAYIGLDLGANVWKLKADATGVTGTGPSAVTQSAHDELSAPIPQLGASVGVHVPGGFVDLRGSYHLLKKGDAKYHHAVVEARAFPLRWLGVRAFHEDERVEVPKGSLSNDFALDVDRQGTGFGVIFRF